MKDAAAQLCPHLEVKIVDSQGRIVPRGEKGELLTRGYSVMPGYWGDEEKTREAIDAARWMHVRLHQLHPFRRKLPDDGNRQDPKYLLRQQASSDLGLE